jgi:hypothetical protein
MDGHLDGWQHLDISKYTLDDESDTQHPSIGRRSNPLVQAPAGLKDSNKHPLVGEWEVAVASMLL